MTAPQLIGGRYRLTRLLGSGGMGDVWEAQDERLHRAVAVKRLHPQAGVSAELAEVSTGRAMREARITARLQHAHAVTVYDVVEDHGQPCLIMQLVPSDPLSARLAQGRVLPVREVTRLGADVASALAAAHQAGIVHRDVKPGNVLLGEDGAARISDFGIAHAMGDVTLTTTGLVTGTPAYLAPEVARGEDSGYAADVFSLGATLYTALEGHPPFGAGNGNPMALLHRVASGLVEPPRQSGPLAPLLERMLQPRPEDRPTMATVADELARAAAGGAAATSRLPSAVGAGDQAHPTPGLPLPVPLDVRDDGDLDDPGDPRDLDDLNDPDDLDDPDDRDDPEAALDWPQDAATADRRRRSALWVVAAALLVLAVLALVLVRTVGSSSPPVTAPAPVSSSTSAPATTSAAAPSSTSSPAPTPPAPSTVPSTTTSTTAPPPTTTTTTTPPPSTTTAAPATPSAADLTSAVTRYYGLMPGGTDQAWPLLTARYQADKTGGRAAYQRFWDQFASVTATDVSATPPGTVQATITYRFKDGRVSRERTTFGLVVDGGVLKIDSSTVTG
jgi:serine/threonine protein kinase